MRRNVDTSVFRVEKQDTGLSKMLVAVYRVMRRYILEHLDLDDSEIYQVIINIGECSNLSSQLDTKTNCHIFDILMVLYINGNT
jgi:predicted aminopeptidase